MTSAEPAPPIAPTAPPWWDRLLVPAVAMMLLVPRLLGVWHRGAHVTDVRGFDEGAYFSAAALVAQGHVLYREVGAAHPPGFYLVAAPFTLIGPPSVSMNVVRSLNSVIGVAALMLVAAVVARVTGDRRAYLGALAIGLVPDVVRADRMVLVDPLLNLTCAVTFLCWWRVLEARDPPDDGDHVPDSPSPALAAFVAGCWLGAAMSVKPWALLMVPAILVTSTRGRRRSEVLPLAAGAVAVTALVGGVTMLLSGRAALDQTVLFQLGRKEVGTAVLERAQALLALPPTGVGTRSLLFLVLVLFGLVLVARRAGAPAGRRLLRFALVWTLCIVAAFAVTGSYDSQYNGHLGPPMTIVAGVVIVESARSLATGPARRRALASLALLAVVLVALHGLRWVRGDALAPVGDLRTVESAIDGGHGCVASFEPGWLVPLDRLPDVDQVGPFASESFVVSWVAAIRSGERQQGPYGPTAVSQALDTVTRCRTVLLGDRGRAQLRTQWDEFEQRYELVAVTFPGGPDVWRRRAGVEALRSGTSCGRTPC